MTNKIEQLIMTTANSLNNHDRRIAQIEALENYLAELSQRNDLNPAQVEALPRIKQQVAELRKLVNDHLTNIKEEFDQRNLSPVLEVAQVMKEFIK